jgi:signal transduction histidine kinase/CheY-like chemotaxis protein
MAAIEYGSNVNLEELRGELVDHVTLTLMGAGALLILVTWPLASLQSIKVIPSVVFPLAILLVGLGWAVRALANARPVLARHLLVWGLTAGLLVAMWFSNEPWLPFLGLMLTSISAMLISGGEFMTTAMVAALAVGLRLTGFRTYPLALMLIALALGVALAWQSVRTLYTALGWAWTMQQRADHLLGLARDRRGELSRALKSLDITNSLLRRTQRELITARKQAEEARLMKEKFAANVSHELRTPLNIILGFSEVMYLSPEVYGDVDWPSTLRRDVYQIYNSSRHLLKMIDDVLELSRFEIVGFTLDREVTPLEPLLHDTVEIVEKLFHGRPVHLEVEVAPGLPVLEIDRTRVRQVLLNLLNNAARFTDEGEVRVRAERSDGEVVVSVSDTGAGIPGDELPHIFDEFYQVDRSLHRRHGGAGLGLAISKHFVEAHDGRIWVESREGAGSTFTFTLPIPEEHVPFARLRMSRPLDPPRTETPAPVLVVDPDPAVATMIGRHLEGYEVVPVAEADQVAEAVVLHHPQAVVCNVPPGGQSDAVALAIKAATSIPVPFIECSLPSQGWVADDLAVMACLTKPVTAAQLLQQIEHLEHARDVLVVDDDRDFCQLVERMLEASGRAFDVQRAYGGEDALQAMRARRPDLVLLDLIMPGVDGFQVLEEMHQDQALADVPVVLLTATSYAEDALAQRGVQQVSIHRPDGLSPAEVLRCLRAMVGLLEPHYDERSTPEEMLLARRA